MCTLIVSVVNSLYYVVLWVKVRRLRTTQRSQVMVSHDDIIYAFFSLAKTFSVWKKVLRERLPAVFLFPRVGLPCSQRTLYAYKLRIPHHSVRQSIGNRMYLQSTIYVAGEARNFLTEKFSKPEDTIELSCNYAVKSIRHCSGVDIVVEKPDTCQNQAKLTNRIRSWKKNKSYDIKKQIKLLDCFHFARIVSVRQNWHRSSIIMKKLIKTNDQGRSNA